MGALSVAAFLTPGVVTDRQTVRTAQMSKAVVSAAQTMGGVCVCTHACMKESVVQGPWDVTAIRSIPKGIPP